MADPKRYEIGIGSQYDPSTTERTVAEGEKFIMPELVTSATTPFNLDSRYYKYTWNGTSVINTAKSLGSYTCAAGYSYMFISSVACFNATGNVYAYFPGMVYFGRVNATGSLVINGTKTAVANGTERKNGTFTCAHAVNGTTKVLTHTCTGPSTAGGAFKWYGVTEVFKMDR